MGVCGVVDEIEKEACTMLRGEVIGTGLAPRAASGRGGDSGAGNFIFYIIMSLAYFITSIMQEIILPFRAMEFVFSLLLISHY